MSFCGYVCGGSRKCVCKCSLSPLIEEWLVKALSLTQWDQPSWGEGIHYCSRPSHTHNETQAKRWTERDTDRETQKWRPNTQGCAGVLSITTTKIQRRHSLCLGVMFFYPYIACFFLCVTYFYVYPTFVCSFFVLPFNTLNLPSFKDLPVPFPSCHLPV